MSDRIQIISPGEPVKRGDVTMSGDNVKVWREDATLPDTYDTAAIFAHMDTDEPGFDEVADETEWLGSKVLKACNDTGRRR